LLLEATARVTSDVLYEVLTVATGAQVDGRFKRRSGESDSSHKAKAAALSAHGRPAPGPEPIKAPGLFAGAPPEQAAEAAE
jgi:hypothetical protein